MVRTHATPLQKFVLQPNVHHLLQELKREHPKLAPYQGEDNIKESKAQWRSKVATMKYRFGKDNSGLNFDQQNPSNKMKEGKENKKDTPGFKFTIDNKIIQEFEHEKEDSQTLPRKIDSNSSTSHKHPIENYSRIVHTSSKPKEDDIRIPELDSELVARLLKEISLVSK
eukprot:TRINITY_DN12748_c0_g1_i1.p1 TRINITY_DN12748_c0_g1~~TRINITY_DN12748_c0_g1_i1.p1  ORF type:complete len:169 (-),score=30.98 TRINITY_DN12748_c0_g1_i1:58-564(-)